MDHDDSTIRAELAEQLRALAKRDPDRLTRALASLDERQQIELALRLSAADRLELLLHAPRPMRLVRSLPDADFYLTVRGVGPADALPVVSLASANQLLHLMDLESWRGDRFDAKRSGGWAALFLEAGEPALKAFLRSADDETLALLLSQWGGLSPIEIDDTPDPGGSGETESGTPQGFVTPDGYHRFSPQIPEHAAAIRRLAELLMEDQPERYQRLIWDAQWTLPSELEEQALHWRQSRLEEHGYPPRDEALSVYAPPLGTTAHPRPLELGEGPAVSRLPLRLGSSRRALSLALERLTGEERERVLHELASLGNHLLVADGADTGDPAHHRQAALKAAGMIEIALETANSIGADDALERLRERPLLEVFREGYRQVAELQDRAREFLNHGWPAGRDRALELLDAPVGPTVAGLIQPRPLYFDSTAPAEESAYRDFRELAEVEQAGAILRVARALGAVFVDRLGLDVDRVLAAEGPPPRMSAFLLTGLAWHAARSSLEAAPLPADVAADFLRTCVSARTADGGALDRALEAYVPPLAGLADLGAADAAALAAFGRGALQRLREECGGLDPGSPLDPRFVSALLIAEDRHG